MIGLARQSYAINCEERKDESSGALSINFEMRLQIFLTDISLINLLQFFGFSCYRGAQNYTAMCKNKICMYINITLVNDNW